MDHVYAYNYWRKAFVEENDFWDKEDFDEWFRHGADATEANPGHFGIVEPGSKEHFNQSIRMSLIAMLHACARGDFGQ